MQINLDFFEKYLCDNKILHIFDQLVKLVS